MEDRIIVRGKDVTDKFTCVICKELPRGAIYQCNNGHILCKECYENPLLKNCPCCRCKLPAPSRRIRNLLAQSFLDDVIQIECPFKANGCGKRLSRNLAETHAAECHYDFEKFGPLVNLCQKLGYPSCNFQVNSGTTALVIKHFQKEHGFYLTQLENFEVELEQFKMATCQRSSSYFWTPIIAKLPTSGFKGHVLLVPILNKTDFSCLSIWLPDSDDPYGSPLLLGSPPPIQIEFELLERDLSENCRISFVQNSISITEAMEISLENLPRPVSDFFLKAHMKNEEKLRIVCKIKPSTGTVPNQTDLSTLTCKINPPLKADIPIGATKKAKRRLLEEESKSKLDKDNLWEFLCGLYSEKTYSGEFCSLQLKNNEYTVKELAFLKEGALLLVLRRGTVAQLKFLRRKGASLNYIGDARVTILHYVLKNDTDKNEGLEKVKFLVTSKVDYKRLTNSNQSLLHYAAFHGDEQTVKYILKLELEVNAQDVNGRTPLHWAARNPNDECLLKISQLLLDHGADPEIKTKNGDGPLGLVRPNMKEKLKKILYSNQENEEGDSFLVF